jgi:hypothetical protein
MMNAHGKKGQEKSPVKVTENRTSVEYSEKG